jgi:hypothetical protein
MKRALLWGDEIPIGRFFQRTDLTSLDQSEREWTSSYGGHDVVLLVSVGPTVRIVSVRRSPTARLPLHDDFVHRH